MEGSGGTIFRMGMERRVLARSRIIKGLSIMALKRGRVYTKRQENMSTRATLSTMNLMDLEKSYTQMETIIKVISRTDSLTDKEPTHLPLSRNIQVSICKD